MTYPFFLEAQRCMVVMLHVSPPVQKMLRHRSGRRHATAPF